MPLPSVSFSSPFRVSVGRLLGGWLGVALTPLLPLLKWIFAPYFSIEKMLAHGLTATTLSQYQIELEQLGAGILLGQILPQLLLCLTVCVAFSWSFGWAGNALEERMRKIRV